VKKVIIVDTAKCIGCRTCEAVCSLVHFGEVNISKARIKVIRYDIEAFFNPVVCFQCEKPYCAAVCPSDAITKSADTGIVKISRDKCTGCKMCVNACPFGMVIMADDVAIKCDQCNGKPSCVEACQAKALTYGVANDIADGKRIALSDKMLDIHQEMLNSEQK
jgi:anaerobic carbon-monoxide dehydrogenase iron sulfur subunit